MKKLILVLFLATLLPTQAEWFLDKPDHLTGSEWLIIEIANESAKKEAFIQFRTEGKVSGKTTINRFSGTYRADANSLKFGPLMMTRMAGSPELMKQESQIIEALGKTDNYKRKRGVMYLQADDRVLLKLRHRDRD